MDDRMIKHEYVPEEDEDDVLADYFEKSATAVRATFGRFEQDVARPVIDYLLSSYRTRPVVSTFAAIYITLSLLPILSFIGFSLFVFATFIFLGLATAVFSASCAVGFFGFWLVCMLIFFVFVSFNLTASALATYVLIRFVARARQDGSRAALSALLEDTREKMPFRGRGRGRRTRAKAVDVTQDPNTTGGDAEAHPVKTERQGSDSDTLVIIGAGSSPISSHGELGEKVPGVPVDAYA
ncbi:hypothetical protein C8Q80DRAFT_1151203 [Daedaleopsis nitida]|nr:hypothetical protein C8Q80DRAFT_1151203 [Daedaleopsis nitida]